MQAVATSFIRDMKGAAAVKAFGELLPKLSPQAQGLVLAALAESGDAAVRPVVLAAIQRDAAVRVAALNALALVGTAEDVPMLAKIAATGPNTERGPAANTLNRLRGRGVDEAILKAMEGAEPPVRVVLIRALAARRYAGAVPTLLKGAEDADATVRAESINALGVLGDDKVLPQLVKLLVGAKSGGERSAAEKSIQTICGKIKDPNARVAPLLAALPGANVEARRSLLQLLGRFGGSKALEAVRAALKDQDAQIHDAAIRAMASWPDASVVSDLGSLMKTAPKPNQKIIALRGYVRLLGLPNKRPPAESLKLYQDAMEAATGPEEKKLVLGDLGQVKHIGALKIAEECLADKALMNEAAVAIVKIAKAIGKAHKAEAIQALTKVTQEKLSRRIRQDAANVLKQLKK
jgi:HEAT repeat protein